MKDWAALLVMAALAVGVGMLFAWVGQERAPIMRAIERMR